jgi:hypothetical protein
MRGSDERPGELFSYVDIEERVPQMHPLRLIRRIVQGACAPGWRIREAVRGRWLSVDCAGASVASAAAESVLHHPLGGAANGAAALYNLLYQSFIGLGADDPVWVPTMFSENRDRLRRRWHASFSPNC